MRRVLGLATLAALVASAYVARRYVRTRDALADVAPELRSPVLPLIPVSFTPRTLPLARLGFRLSTKPGRGVTMTQLNVDGEPAVRVLA
ncbi:MAG: alpha/beta hydrolase, partial [Mycobacterium sp.]